MKSYFLEGTCSYERTTEILRYTLPGQENPWVLHDASGNAIAYFNVSFSDPELVTPAITVDISR